MTVTRSPGKILRYTKSPKHFQLAESCQEDSGHCEHAQAIMERYGPQSRPVVDENFIRVTDPASGDRYYYKTPESVVASLMAFDAGLPDGETEVINVAARLVRIRRKYNYTPTSAVREWARQVPELAASVNDRGTLPRSVIDKFMAAHPEARPVHAKRAREITPDDARPGPDPVTVTEISEQARVRLGQLAGGKLTGSGIRNRRTRGSMKLTRTLLQRGWSLPSAPS